MLVCSRGSLEPLQGRWPASIPAVADKPVPGGRVSNPVTIEASGRWTIPLPLREDNPGNARRFIGLGDPCPVFPPPDDEALEPAAPPVLLALDCPDD